MTRKILFLFTLITLFACSNGDDDSQTNTETENPPVYYLSLNNNNYDISDLFFIKNEDYENPILTCHTFIVESGDTIKIVGETNMVNDEVFVTAVLKLETEVVRTINLTRSTEYINRPLVVNGLCYSPNTNFNATNARLWKDDTNSTYITIE
ncbi:hypothetical protein [Flavobacterium sp.]|uniref:hypothetical protein n=1 Tax=Flavobacterium sp. TaxID=239 RepID=UPI0039E2909F